MNPERIKLTEDYGNAKKGTIYILDLKTRSRHHPDIDMYWKEGTKEEDNNWLMVHWIEKNYVKFKVL